MDGSRYDTDIDLSNRNNSHTLMVELIGGSKRVLDVGCSTGYLAHTLRGRDCSVSGVELDAASAEQARPDLDRLVIGDVDHLDLLEAFGDERFDVVVFGDVLEHLRDPLPVLRTARRLLAEGGSVVASIPNVAHGSVRLALLAGRFDYQDLGLLDRTHLRFFTRQSIVSLFRDAGMVAVDVQRTTAGFFDTPLPVVEAEFPAEVVEAVNADPEATTYQFVLRAVADDATAAVSGLAAEAESQRVRAADLERQVAVLRDAARDALVRAEDAEKRAVDLESRLETTIEALEAERDAGGAFHEQLDRVLGTRTMRWSRQARGAYGRLRRLLADE